MASVRVNCTTCGIQELRALDVRARVCIDNNESQYRFTCPDCSKVAVLHTDRRVIDLLQAGGVRVDLWHLPLELFEDHNGELVTHDDIIDFHLLLEDESSFIEAVNSLR